MHSLFEGDGGKFGRDGHFNGSGGVTGLLDLYNFNIDWKGYETLKRTRRERQR